MRHFSFRPTLTMRGRKFRGLRGFAGKPFHPPLTDIPVGGYVLGAVFDLISFAGAGTAWSREFYQAATFCFIGGALVSLGAALTGFWDWLRSTEPGNQARRTVNSHATIMLSVTVLALADIGLRWLRYHDGANPPSAILGLSLAVALAVATGSTYGGTLVFDYGFNVETAGDSPVWHPSETDVLPGRHPAPSSDGSSPVKMVAP
ncbi:MAG TPA: DUF2231 domain-containing protein [Acidimicrobiales bacterium]|nr:DUF2231 domain-containing protein [Acidimicrobiales bacterium]